MKKTPSNQSSNNKKESENKLRGARVFSTEQPEPTNDSDIDIKPAMLVTEDVPFVPTNEMESSFLEVQPISTPDTKPAKSSAKKGLLILIFAVVLASFAELGLFIYSLSIQMDWLATLWLIILALAGVIVIRQVLAEYQGIKRLKRQAYSRKQSEYIANSTVIGLAEKHCLGIAKTLPDEFQPLVAKWHGQVSSHHCDNEVLSLFEHQVIAPIDKMALKQVTNNAAAGGVMIAVSPFALLDMFIVLWRNFRMMNQISKTYGVNLGYLGRIRLIKNIFRTMLYAGAAEILSDAGNYALGAGLTGKISTRVGQGMGAGVLTARIGLKAINETRPIPWIVEPKPKLSGISKQLLTVLNKHLNP